MQESYQKVLRKLDYFGFPEGYVPFPALSRSATASTPLNAFNTSLQTAKEKMYIARDKEQIALQDNRKFETDAASFQSELVKLEQSYDEQLIQICGELKDGSRSVPAIDTPTSTAMERSAIPAVWSQEAHFTKPTRHWSALRKISRNLSNNATPSMSASTTKNCVSKSSAQIDSLSRISLGPPKQTKRPPTQPRYQ
ncbi:MAG: hypothetical protein H6728_01570 [Myxococcales bacterium]|nr:hypothetical protein [Myxococcales bacterium]